MNLRRMCTETSNWTTVKNTYESRREPLQRRTIGADNRIRFRFKLLVTTYGNLPCAEPCALVASALGQVLNTKVFVAVRSYSTLAVWTFDHIQGHRSW